MDYLRLVAIKGESERLEPGPTVLARVRWGQACGSVGDCPDLANNNRYQIYQVAGVEYRRSAVSLGLTGTQRFTPSLTWTNTLLGRSAG